MRADAWLAERFGRPVFTAEDGDAPDALPDVAPAFLQARVGASEVARVGALEAAGWRVVDVNLTFRREPSARARLGESGGSPIRLARAEDREAVLRIAAEDYGVSRFHLDPRVPATVAAAIKRDWVGAYFDGCRGDRLLVAHEGGAPVGFLAIDQAPDSEVIDLIAVAESARGRGTGTRLVMRLLAEAGNPVLVGTQVSNLGAQRFYERLGFEVHAARYVLHRHV